MIILISLSSFAFIFYGVMVLSTDHMIEEFKRYGLGPFRTLTGYLELLGGIGSLLGILFPLILTLSSLGLSILMLLGMGVRIKVRDPWYEIIPAFLLMLVNAYIFIFSISDSVL